MAEVAGRAVGVGSGKKSRCSGKLDVLWRLRRVVISRWGDGMHGAVLVDGGWHGMVHDGRVRHGSSAGGHRSTTLAAVATMRQLVVVKTAGQLSLFQVSGNVFVGHLLEASLEKINFLQFGVRQESKQNGENVFVPHPRSKLCHRQWMLAFCSSERRNRVG